MMNHLKYKRNKLCGKQLKIYLRKKPVFMNGNL